jgi:ABC-2 type transport system permease protein
MSGVKTILRRELGAYFNSPLAYVVAIGFMLLNSSLYVLGLWIENQVSMRGFFEWVSWSACFVIPAITMRLWAEEKRGATYELLFTFPMGTIELVVAKFLAALVFYAFCLSGSLFIPLILWRLSTPGLGPEWAAIAAAYLGSLFAGALLIALGLFLSGLCRDQIEAFIITLVVVLALRLTGFTPIAGQIDSVFSGAGTFLSESVSFSTPLSRFARGLVDLGDVAYFVIWAAVFLFLNAVGLDRRLKPGSGVRYLATIGLGIPAMILAGSLAAGSGPRFDWTAEHMYTVSPAAVEVLEQVPKDEAVRVKLYFSPKDEMPAGWTTLERDVMEKLEELQRRSHGRLKVEVVHLHADDAILRAIQEARQTSMGGEETDKKKGERGAVEEKLLQEGVVPFRVQTGGLTGSETKVVYAALSMTYGANKKETIPQLAPNETASLEQDLITRVYRMVSQKKPVVGLLAPIEAIDVPPQQLQLLAQLGIPLNQIQREKDDYSYARMLLSQAEQYDVRRLKPDAPVPLPADLSTLVILAPQRLSARMAWEVQRFLAGGGSVIVASRAFDAGLAPVQNGVGVMLRKTENGLGQILDRYGVSVPAEMVLAPQSLPLSYSVGPFSQPITVDFRWNFRLDPSALDRTTSLTNGVGGDLMVIDGASPVVLDEAKLKQLGISAMPVINAPPRAWTREVPEAQIPRDINDVKPPTGVVRLAVMLKGTFPAPEGARPAWPAAQGAPPPPEGPEPPAVTSKAGSLLVVGTDQPFTDQQIADRGGRVNWSGALLKNSVDALSLGDILLRLTLREPTPRPIKPLERSAIVFYQFLIVGLAPLAYLALGIARLVMRKRKQEAGAPPRPHAAAGVAP